MSYPHSGDLYLSTLAESLLIRAYDALGWPLCVRVILCMADSSSCVAAMCSAICCCLGESILILFQSSLGIMSANVGSIGSASCCYYPPASPACLGLSSCSQIRLYRDRWLWFWNQLPSNWKSHHNGKLPWICCLGQGRDSPRVNRNRKSWAKCPLLERLLHSGTLPMDPEIRIFPVLIILFFQLITGQNLQCHGLYALAYLVGI